MGDGRSCRVVLVRMVDTSRNGKVSLFEKQNPLSRGDTNQSRCVLMSAKGQSAQAQTERLWTRLDFYLDL